MPEASGKEEIQREEIQEEKIQGGEARANEMPAKESPANELRWNEIHARTDDNLAAAREILKDAGTVMRWSQKLLEDVQHGREARQAQKEAGQAQKEAGHAWRESRPAPQQEQPEGQASSRFVVVVGIEHDLDLIRSPQLRRLLLSLAADAALKPAETSMRSAETGVQSAEAGSQPPESWYAVVVDLRGAALMDMSGVSCLIAGHLALTESGRRLVVLLAPGSQPQRVFATIKLDRIIRALSSLDEM